MASSIYRKKSVKTPPMDCRVGKLGLFRPFFQFHPTRSNAKGSGPCFRATISGEFHPFSPKNGPDPGLCISLSQEVSALTFRLKVYNGCMHHILDQSVQQLQTWMIEHDERPYRAAQIRNWIFARRASSWEQMTDLPRGLREQLASEFDIWSAEIAIHRKDGDGTEKLLLTLADGRSPAGDAKPADDGAAATNLPAVPPKGPLQIECVLLPRRQGPLQHVHQHAGRLCDEMRFSARRVWAA